MAEDIFDRALELVVDAGQTLLENGGEVFRVQQTMEIMAASLGVRDFTLSHAVLNTASGNVARKCGFQLTHYGQYSRLDGSETFDAAFYELNLKGDEAYVY